MYVKLDIYGFITMSPWKEQYLRHTDPLVSVVIATSRQVQ